MEESSVLIMLQYSISLVFFIFTSVFLLLSLLLRILCSNNNPWWCNCDVCRAYVSSSWSSDFHNIIDWYAHLLRRSPTATIHIHVHNNIVTANPHNVEHILTTRFHNYPKGKPFSAILGDLLGSGIFNADGENWRFQRKMASLELGSSSVRSHAFSAVSNEIQHRLLPLLLHSADAVDLQDVFRRFSFDTICNISFGLDPGCLELSLPASVFAAAFDTASHLSARRAAAAAPMVWRLKRLVGIGTERELRVAIGMVRELAEEVISQRRKQGFASGHDLLSRFMAATVNDDDDRLLRDIVISFLLAGRDTVASGLTSFFMLLSSHPEVEEAILDEISAVLDGDETAVIGCEKLKGMQYVHAAVYESMRLYPPVQFDSKFCEEDDVLPDGTFVRKGTRVTYHPYAMGRMDGIWGEDCMEFRPERWLAGGAFRPESPYRYPVFQGGLRVCVGKELAVMEMKAVIVSVVRDFRVEVEGALGTHKFSPGLTATIAGGLKAQVRPRRAC